MIELVHIKPASINKNTVKEMGSKNPEINSRNVSMTEHAIQRAKERFGLKHPQEALGYCRRIIREGKNLGIVKAEDGNMTYLIARNREAVYLSLDHSTIITVKRVENLTYEPLKKVVIEYAKKELRKIDRKINTLSKRNKLLILESNYKIAELRLRMEKTRSERVKRECEKEVQRIMLQIEEKERELDELHVIKRRIANSIVSLM